MEYRILGPFDIRHEGESLHLGGGRQRALLALLVLHANTVVSIDRIIDRLWEEDPPDTAANIIQVYMSRLRKLLDPDRERGTDGTVLLTRRPGYLIRLEPNQLDAFEFTRLATEGREALANGAPGVAAALLQQGLDIWHGEVLADFSFEEFARAEIDRLTEERLSVMEDLYDARLALGQHDELISEIERTVRDHPLRESLWAKLMLALYRSGRQAEALRTYQRAADTLVEELGIDPSPMLQDLEDDILQQASSLDLPKQSAMVSTSGDHRMPLIGRENQLAAIEDSLRMVNSGRTVLIRLEGEPGSGVGRLLQEVANIAERMGIAHREAHAFEVSGSHAGEVIEQIDRPASGPYVMTVSSAHVADPTSVGLLRAWMTDGLPKLLVLGTEPAEGRTARPLRQLEGAVGEVGTVVTLTVGRLTRDDLDRWLDPKLSEALFEATSGYPFELGEALLALRRDGVIDWDDQRVILKGSLPDSLYHSLALTVRDLEKDQRRLVEAVAVAGVPISLPVASAILDVEPEEALELVENLVGRGYLAELGHGVVVADALQSGRLTQRFGEMRRSTLYGVLLSAYDSAGETADAVTGRFALACGQFDVAAERLQRSGISAVEAQHLGEAQPLLEGAIEALEALGQTNTPEWGRAHLALAQCHRLAGWPNLAAAALLEALPHTTGAEKVDALGWAAQVADDRQDPVSAEWWVARAERAALRHEEPAKLGSLLSLRGRVLSRLGFAEEADHVVTKAQDLLDTHGGATQLYMARYNRAWIAFDRGDAKKSESLFASMIDALPEGDARIADLTAWWSRGLFKIGRVAQGLESAQSAIGLGLRSGDIGPVFLGHMAIAEGASAHGNGEVALEAANEMLGLVLQQLPAWENAARYLVAQSHRTLGDLEAAANEVSNAIDLCPTGANGHRWLRRCQALEIAIRAEHGPVDLDACRELVEQILATQLVEPGIELLTVIASAAESDAESAALTGAHLAADHGLVALARSAVESGNLWDTPVGTTVKAMVEARDRSIPSQWR